MEIIIDHTIIFYAEFFSEIPQNIVADVGDSVRFSCTVNATLETFVEWEYQFTGDNKVYQVIRDKLPP